MDHGDPCQKNMFIDDDDDDDNDENCRKHAHVNNKKCCSYWFCKWSQQLWPLKCRRDSSIFTVHIVSSLLLQRNV